MKAKPMIGDYEVPGIQRIGTVEQRRLVEIPVPGLAGSYHQDLGQGPIAIVIEGTLAGDDARDTFLTTVRGMFNEPDPVDFVADITTATELEQVHLSELNVGEAAGSAHTFRYRITLAQHTPPPPPPPALGPSDLDAGLLDEAAALAEAMQIPDLLGAVPELSDPTPPLKGTLDGVKSALEGLSGVSDAFTSLFGGP